MNLLHLRTILDNLPECCKQLQLGVPTLADCSIGKVPSLFMDEENEPNNYYLFIRGLASVEETIRIKFEFDAHDSADFHIIVISKWSISNPDIVVLNNPFILKGM